ncbi:MAG: hypothetical protein LBD81_01655 [Holosporaceae bacterium]|jgi:hypothetical protein|nr:hypothetical protein [Holosporaceae bacterium]
MLRRSDIKANAEDFVLNARDEQPMVDDLHSYIKPISWPIDPEVVAPSMAAGSAVLNRNLTITMKEIEWNSLDRHVKALNVSKAEWIRYAILKLIQEEQLHFFKNRKAT